MGVRSMWGVSAVAGVLALGACGEEQPLSPADTEALVAAAPQLSLSQVVDELDLPEEQRGQIKALAEDLHVSMMAVHEAVGDMEDMDPAERAAFHASLEGDLADLHERHEAFLGSLDDEQRKAFVDHVHAQLEEHGLHESSHGAGHHGGSHP